MSIPEPPPAAPAPPTTEMGDVADKVKGPAISLIVVGAISAVLQVLGILANLLGMGMASADMSQFEGMEGMEWMAPLMSGTVSILISILALAVAAVLIFGGLKMKSLQSYGLAMAATILAMVPCLTPCCLGIPFGIWALVVMLKPEVKAAFG